MVTRTFRVYNYNCSVYAHRTDETYNIVVSINHNTKRELKRRLKEMYGKYVLIKSELVETYKELRGMTDEDFYNQSCLLDNETRKPIKNC